MPTYLWISTLTALFLALPAPGPIGGATPAPGPVGGGKPAPGPVGGDRAWPVAGSGARGRPAVERGFEPPPQPWAAGHRGVDLRAGPGVPVRAAAAGRVVFAGRVAGRGVVTVELSGTGRPSLRISYEPVRSTATVGDDVAAGGMVGVVEDGPWHCADGCLHWGLRRGEEYLDPLSLLPASMRREGPSRLLPVRGVPVPPSPPQWARGWRQPERGGVWSPGHGGTAWPPGLHGRWHGVAPRPARGGGMAWPGPAQAVARGRHGGARVRGPAWR